MSSYKVEAKGDTDRLTPEALKGLVNKPELLALTESLTPDHTVAFWMPESEMEAMELELGAGVRLKTRGDGPFLDSLAKLEAGTVTKCNFTGDGKTGASWTDNIMAQKCSEGAAAEIREQGDGAEDEEWVFVETLDKCFENVCELDLIFHMDKVHYILQEVVMGGMVLETNMNEIVAQIEAQNRLE
ncbi:C15orf38-AP3S2 isoform 3, partial [Pan troglodytes]